MRWWKSRVHNPTKRNQSKVIHVATKGGKVGNDKGVIIKAKKSGACYIYAYAQNGVFKKLKVTVN